MVPPRREYRANTRRIGTSPRRRRPALAYMRCRPISLDYAGQDTRSSTFRSRLSSAIDLQNASREAWIRLTTPIQPFGIRPFSKAIFKHSALALRLMRSEIRSAGRSENLGSSVQSNSQNFAPVAQADERACRAGALRDRACRRFRRIPEPPRLRAGAARRRARSRWPDPGQAGRQHQRQHPARAWSGRDADHRARDDAGPLRGTGREPACRKVAVEKHRRRAGSGGHAGRAAQRQRAGDGSRLPQERGAARGGAARARFRRTGPRRAGRPGAGRPGFRRPVPGVHRRRPWPEEVLGRRLGRG